MGDHARTITARAGRHALRIVLAIYNLPWRVWVLIGWAFIIAGLANGYAIDRQRDADRADGTRERCTFTEHVLLVADDLGVPRTGKRSTSLLVHDLAACRATLREYEQEAASPWPW